MKVIKEFSEKFDWKYQELPNMKGWYILFKDDKGQCVATIKEFDSKKDETEYTYFDTSLYIDMYNISVLSETICICSWKCGTIGVIKCKKFGGDIVKKKDKKGKVSGSLIRIPSDSIKTI